MKPVVEAFGERGLRARFDGPVEEACRHARALAAKVRDAAIPDVVDAWNGARTVVVELHDGSGEDAVSAILQSSTDHAGEAGGRTIEIGAVYDGDDLDEVAGMLGVFRDEVVRLHASAEYTVAFLGFAPGFPYLIGTPAPLDALPRRSSPRKTVPAGSIAVAGGWTGIYPARTPGGWRLLARTDASLFDATRAQPALLAPGDRVRFVPQ